MSTTNDMTVTNQFGEKEILDVNSIGQAVPNLMPAKSGITAISAIATADATDLATAITLANANKAKINAILAAMKVVS